MNTSSSSLDEFLERLASSKPTPGGGSASALAGGVAAALVAMVGRITMGKKDEKYRVIAAEMEKLTQKADELRSELMTLADRDAEAFERVMAAYRLPKSTEEERAERQRVLQEALKGATEAPCQIAEACSKVLELAQDVAQKGTPTAISDAGTAAYLAEAALHSALLNVDINLKYIKDEGYCQMFRKKRAGLASQAQSRREKIISLVEGAIK